jgi:transcriptional regulator of acetoin/glycerol metabolism
VAETARRIEVEMFMAAYSELRIILVPGGDLAAMLAVDADDLVVGACRAARQALDLAGDLRRSPRPTADTLGYSGLDTLRDAERAVFARALARFGGNVSAASRSLGVPHATLHRKLPTNARH